MSEQVDVYRTTVIEMDSTTAIVEGAVICGGFMTVCSALALYIIRFFKPRYLASWVPRRNEH